jgi:hypothetical protein
VLGPDNYLYCAFVLIIGMSVIGATYAFLSIRTGNFVNALTPFLLLGLPAYFLLEFLWLSISAYGGSRFAYTYVYVTYTAGVIAKAVGYLAAPARGFTVLLRVPKLRLPGLPQLFLILAFALYLPVLIEYRDLLGSPREIYALTRTGYGVQSFLSTFCIYVGFILKLFSPRVTRRSILVYFALASVLLYMHGSKGPIFSLLLVWLYFAAFVQQHRFGIGRVIGLGLVSSTVLIGLFALTSSRDLQNDFFSSIAGYSSEYTRNAMIVIDDNDLILQGGRLSLENTFYSLIPREIFPDKRKDFGSLWLANKYYPERFQDERGAPAFGLGVLYADFGVFAILYYAIGEFLWGLSLGILAAELRRTRDPGNFFLFVIFMDVALIPTGTGFPLIIYYALAHLMKMIGNQSPAERDDFSHGLQTQK